MKIITESTVRSPFTGYAPGNVYQLVDGSRWQQRSGETEASLIHRPKATVYTDDGDEMMQVEGMAAAIRVVEHGV